jgi:hypothetical protein
MTHPDPIIEPLPANTAVFEAVSHPDGLKCLVSSETGESWGFVLGWGDITAIVDYWLSSPPAVAGNLTEDEG